MKNLYYVDNSNNFNNRILTVTLHLSNSPPVHLISVYAPDTSRAKEEMKDLYDKLQDYKDKR